MMPVARVIALLSGLWLAVGQSIASPPNSRDLSQELLLRARQALGGERALAAVKGLVFEVAPEGGRSNAVIRHAILLPDKYEQTKTSPAATFYLSGDAYWTESPAATPSARAAELAMRRQLARWIIVMLVPRPSDVGMTISARTGVQLPDDGPRVDVLTYQSTDFSLDLYLDAVTGHPVGYTWPFWTDRPGIGSYIAMFGDYHTIQGVRYPGSWNSRFGVNASALTRTRSNFRNVTVNPPDLATRFVRRPRFP